MSPSSPSTTAPISGASPRRPKTTLDAPSRPSISRKTVPTSRVMCVPSPSVNLSLPRGRTPIRRSTGAGTTAYIAPESTSSSSSTARRRSRGLLKRTLIVVRPMQPTPCRSSEGRASGAHAFTRNTPCRHASRSPKVLRDGRHRRLPPAGRPRLGRPPRARRCLRPPRHPLRLVHGPPLPAGAADGALLRGVDDGSGARGGDRARAPRPPRARERLPPSGAPRQMAITLDHASGGRVELGLGSGSYAPEFAEFGLDFPKAAERAGRLAEAIEVIRLLFTEDAPSYDGRYYRLRDRKSVV